MKPALIRRNLLAQVTLSLVAGFIVAAPASSEDAPPQVMAGSGQKAEVRILQPERKIEVRIINRKKIDLPNSIGITIRSPDGTQRDLELSAMDPETKEKGYYHGSLPPTQESYVGVMIKIPFKKTKTVFLRPESGPRAP